MGSLAPSPELSARIQDLINELQVGDPLRNWPDRVCKEELNALPIQGDINYIWAIRPDGTVLCMDHVEFNHPTEPETDPQAIYVAIAEGARTYPELQALVPALPAGVRPCESCLGTGAARDHPPLGPYACFSCGGLGWTVIRRPLV